jgi:hypothetical protein
MPNSAVSDLSDSSNPLRQLARRMSINAEDAGSLDEELLRHALRAMGVPSHNDKEVLASLHDSLDEYPVLPPVVVIRAGSSVTQIPFSNPGVDSATVEWEVGFEDGTLIGGQSSFGELTADREGRYSIALPFPLDVGYYSFRLRLRSLCCW